MTIAEQVTMFYEYESWVCMGSTTSTPRIKRDRLGDVRLHAKTGKPYIYEFCGRETLGWCRYDLFVSGQALKARRVSRGTLRDGPPLTKAQRKTALKKT